MKKPQKFTIPAPAGVLEGVWHLPDACPEPGRRDAPRAIAVVAHPLPIMGGTMDNKVVTTLTKAFAELGFAALRFNFRGVGASTGAFDGGNGEVEDVLAMVRHAQQEWGELPLVLAGFSFGGFVQARAAQRLQPHQMVLVAPAAGKYDVPPVPHNTLVVHGEQDEVIPLADVLEWARSQHLPITVLPEAGHFFHGRLTQLRDIVKAHFSGAGL